MPVKTFLLKVDSSVYTVWQSSAKASGISVSEWIRRKCNGDETQSVGPNPGTDDGPQPKREKAANLRKLGTRRRPVTDQAIDKAAAQVYEQEPEYQSAAKVLSEIRDREDAKLTVFEEEPRLRPVITDRKACKHGLLFCKKCK